MFEFLGEKKAQEVVDARNAKGKKPGKMIRQSSGLKTPKKSKKKSDLDSEHDYAEVAEKNIVDEEVVKDWFGKLLAVDEAFRERLFIVQIASDNGWKLAKAVAMRKSGKSLDEDLQ